MSPESESTHVEASPDERRGPEARRARAARRIGRHTGLLMVGDLVDRGLGFAFLIVATKVYGLEVYGAYLVALGAFQIVRALVSFGLGKSLVRDAAAAIAVDDLAKLKGAIKLGFLLSLPLAILCGAVLMFGASELVAALLPAQRKIADPIRVFGFLTPIFSFNFVLLQSLYGLGRIRDMVIANNMVEPVTRLAALLVLFGAGAPGSYAIPGAYAIALVLSSAYAVFVFARHVWPKLAGVVAVMRVRETLAFVIPITLNDLASRSFKAFNVGVFAVFRTTVDVSIFDVALKLTGVAYFFSSALVGAFRPRIAALHARGETEALSAEARVYTRWILTFALLPFGMMIAFPADMLGLLGPQFVPAATTLRILAVALLIGQAAGPLMALLVMTGRSRQSVYCLALAGGLYILLSLQTVPLLGTVGAAVSTLVTVMLLVPVGSFYVQRELSIRLYSWGMLRSVVAAAVAVAVAYAVSLVLPESTPEAESHLVRIVRAVALGSAYAVTYVGILLKLGIGPEERAVLAEAGGLLGKIVGKLTRLARR